MIVNRRLVSTSSDLNPLYKEQWLNNLSVGKGEQSNSTRSLCKKGGTETESYLFSQLPIFKLYEEKEKKKRKESKSYLLKRT